MPLPRTTRFSATPPPPPPPPSPRFCPHCGTPWNLLWIECPACAARSAPPPAASSLLIEPSLLPAAKSSVPSALALYFTLLGVSVLGLIILRLSNPGHSVGLAIGAVDSVIVIAWCIVTRKNLLPALRTLPALPWYLLAVAGALFTFSCAYFMTEMLHVLVNMPISHYSKSFMNQPFAWPLLILTVCIQPAVIEELAFRGIIYGGMRQTLKPLETILVTAGMFTILHLSVPSIPHLFTIGVALGFLRLRTGSIYPGMALHFTHNFLCILSEQYSQ